MAALEFILQGLTASAHVDVLPQLFDLPDIQRVLVSVAFVTEGGVEQIEPQLRRYASCVTVFAGIRNNTTTYQGLARLHGIVRELYTVDTGSRTVIFHPKLYLVRGSKRARLVVGSANLTLAGLYKNIEAGISLDLDLASADNKALIDNIEMLFAASVTDHPDHIVRVGAIADLDELLAANRLVEEVKASRNRDARDLIVVSDQGDDEIDDSFPRMKLKVRPLQSNLFRPKSTTSFLKRNEMTKNPESSETPQISEAMPAQTPEVTPAANNPSNTAGRVELETEVSPATTFNYYFRKKRRRGDGPRLRAARAKAEAIRLGRKWYRTGDPCIYGHYEDRLVSNGKCRECNRLDCERSNRLGRLYR